jgi:hypothetical protein
MPNILITPAITIAGGLAVFGATQLAQRFGLDPVTDLMKALGRAAYVEFYYANVCARPDPPDNLKLEASVELRKCASELKGSLRAVRFHRLFCLMRQIPSKKDIERIVSLLIGQANNVSGRDGRSDWNAADVRSDWNDSDELKTLLGI